MSAHRVILRLPGQDPRVVATLEAASAEAAAMRVAQRMPFLPPAYVWIDDRALAALYVPPRAHDTRPRTAGQKRWQEKLDRQRRAERWRQHWIDKANAKAQNANAPRG
jgi:hypothetical protein